MSDLPKVEFLHMPLRGSVVTRVSNDPPIGSLIEFTSNGKQYVGFCWLPVPEVEKLLQQCSERALNGLCVAALFRIEDGEHAFRHKDGRSCCTVVSLSWLDKDWKDTFAERHDDERAGAARTRQGILPGSGGQPLSAG